MKDQVSKVVFYFFKKKRKNRSIFKVRAYSYRSTLNLLLFLGKFSRFKNKKSSRSYFRNNFKFKRGLISKFSKFKKSNRSFMKKNKFKIKRFLSGSIFFKLMKQGFSNNYIKEYLFSRKIVKPV